MVDGASQSTLLSCPLVALSELRRKAHTTYVLQLLVGSAEHQAQVPLGKKGKLGYGLVAITKSIDVDLEGFSGGGGAL